jgi:hypothetical protein
MSKSESGRCRGRGVLTESKYSYVCYVQNLSPPAGYLLENPGATGSGRETTSRAP